MSYLFWLTEEQFDQFKPFFSKERGGSGLDDGRHIFKSTENSLQSQKRGRRATADRLNQGWSEYKSAGFMGQSRAARSVPSDQRAEP